MTGSRANSPAESRGTKHRPNRLRHVSTILVASNPHHFGGSQMKRYVALVVRGRVGWTVLFPDFPGAEESGISLHVVLWKAQRLIGDRAVIFNSLGVEMPVPMSA